MSPQPMTRQLKNRNYRAFCARRKAARICVRCPQPARKLGSRYAICCEACARKQRELTRLWRPVKTRVWVED